MKHLDVVDGELAAVPVEERLVPGVIGQTIELFILKLQSPDAEVWTACTATSAVAGLDNTHFQDILLSNGLIQRTPCECAHSEEVISCIDEQVSMQLEVEGIGFTDVSTVHIVTVPTELYRDLQLSCFLLSRALHQP